VEKLWIIIVEFVFFKENALLIKPCPH